MIARNRNELWGRTLMDELARAGVRHLVVSPGSRSAPVVLAAVADGRFQVHVQIDERSAAYIALGVGKGTGVPAAVVTTSGTAVANLFPAVVEAFHSEVPLLLLTADRPPRLRGADANQTVDQLRIFGGYVRLFEELSPAEASERALRHLRSVVCRAVAAAVGDPAGPVHLNLPFDKPLEPVPVDGDLPDALARGESPAARGRADGAPWTHVLPRRGAWSAEGLTLLATAFEGARRPLLVAGPLPRPWEAGPALCRAASALGVPLLADPLSGARFPTRSGVAGSGTAAPLVGGYDLALRAPGVRDALRPDLVIRMGSAPTSAVLTEWMAGLEDVPSFVVDGGGRWKDHGATATAMIPADPVAVLDAMARPGWAEPQLESGWGRAWGVVEAAVRKGIASALATGCEGGDGGPEAGVFEGTIASELLRSAVADTVLFVSGSMPIRDLDAFGPSHEHPLLALGNRGASGIDGIVSTAAGVSLGTGRRVVVLLGDLALLHDAGGLSALRTPGVDVVLVVVNNDGGGIFHFLPVREHEPAFTPCFATPHGRGFSQLAAFHDLPYSGADLRSGEDEREGGARTGAVPDPRPAAMQELRRVLEAGLEGEGSGIVEIRTDREENRRRRTAVVERIAAAAEDALNQVA